MRSYFISSTFIDMNFERDWFNEEILPKFREAAHSHGEEADAIDLRIGIDTRKLETPERLKQVLGVCSKLISKCKPLMIVFIGDKYGYTVDANVITVEFAEELNAEMHTQVLKKGITHLEIDFGIFQQRSSKCIICMRTLRGKFSEEAWKKFFEQDKNSKKQLIALKDKLKSEYGDRIIEYTANWNGTELEDFRTNDGRDLAEVLLERMIADCKVDWLAWEKLSWQEKEEKAAWQFAKVRAENFYAREDTVAKLENIFSGGDNIIFLKSAKGTGKTSLLSKIAIDFKEFGNKVRCIFSGTSTRSSNSLDILRQMVFYAEKVAGKDHFETNTENPYAAHKQRLAEICKQIKEPLFFIIDAVDQIDIDSHSEHLDFLIKADNVHYLVSGADFDFSKAQRVLGGRVEPLEFLKDDEVEEVLRGILVRNGRNLFPEIASVVNKSQEKNSPLFLEFVAQIFFLLTAREFNNLDYNEVIQVAVRHVDNMSSKKISDVAVYILKEAANIIFEKPEKAIAAVRLLAISPHGLRRSDLESILKLNTLDYARLIWYLHTFFFERQSGAIDFNHSLIRDGILNDIDKNYIDDSERKITAQIKKNLPAQDWLRCLDGATFAQKTRDYEFLATLYSEAFTTENSRLIYGIAQALRSDDGTTCKELLKNHWDELPDETAGGCYGFFITFPFILQSSREDYGIIKEILTNLSIPSDKAFFYFANKAYSLYEINVNRENFFGDENIFTFYVIFTELRKKRSIAKLEMLLGNYKKAKEQLENIVLWGEKNPHINSIDWIHLICSAYGMLTQVEFVLNPFERSVRIAKKYLECSKRVMELAESLKFTDDQKVFFKFSLATAYAQMASFNSDNLPYEKILEYQISAKEIYSELINIHPERQFLSSGVSNLLDMIQTNMNLKNFDIVRELLTQCEEYANRLTELYPHILEAVSGVAAIYFRMSQVEIELEEYEQASAYIDESLRLSQSVIKFNPYALLHIAPPILPTLYVLIEIYTKRGDKERTAHYKKIAAEILKRMSKF